MVEPPSVPPAPSAEVSVWLDALPAAVLQVDAADRVLWANAAARQQLDALAVVGADLRRTLGLAPDVDSAAPLALPDGRWAKIRRAAPQAGVRLLLFDDAQDLVDARQVRQRDHAVLTLARQIGRLGLWESDPRNQHGHWDRHVHRFWGLDEDRLTADFEAAAAQIVDEDRDTLRAAFRASLTRPGVHAQRYRVQRPDGSIAHLHSHWAVADSVGGQAQGVVGIIVDDTEAVVRTHERAEVRARGLSARFDLAVRTAGIGYWVREGDAERADWSEQMRTLHGLPPEAQVPTLREWYAHFVHPDDRELVHQRFRRWLAGETSDLQAELRIVRTDGQVRHLRTHSMLEHRGVVPVHFGIVIDVSDRRLADQALRRADERAALAARGAGIGTWELDRLSGTNQWDPQMWRLRGRAPRSQAPTAAEMLDMVHPADHEVMRRRFVDAGHSDEIVDHQFRVLWPDGSEHWLASRSATVRDAQGAAERRIGVNWDITAARQAEAERRDREAAEQANVTKSRFLARMSHELRTPLNAVLGFTQLLLARAPDATARDWLGHVESAGQHLLSLINDVLDLASLDTGELRIELRPVELHILLADTLPLLEPLRAEHDIQVQLRVPAIRLSSDPVRLRQVLLNLLGNALKYNRPQGRVTVTARTLGDRAVLTIEDTGRGMSEAQLRGLYEPFNRLGIESEGIQGTGIGLTIVKALVHRLGGTISVRSRIGEGSCFELQLPLAGGPAIDAYFGAASA